MSHKRVRILLALFCLVGLTTGAQAEKISVKLPTGLAASAEYIEGDPQRPAFLVIHGLLQTHQFLATQKIIEGIAGFGYTVLGPNLSFGIVERQKSLQCEAAHTHTLQGDLKEIDFWIQWLRNKGYPSVVIVGHSWGSQHVIAYQTAYNNKSVSGIIVVSLVRAAQKEATLELQKAKALIKKDDRSLQAYPFGYCKRYMSTAEGYLSYAEWTDQRVLESLATLKKNKVPVYAILGSKDKRIDDQWVKSLRQASTVTSLIEGANHFFSSIYEFDLIDRLETIIGELTGH
jgi:dienelactone hydrolase